MILVRFYYGFFFFKQKTAYEMRISDWSSDVCSSDLESRREQELPLRNHHRARGRRHRARHLYVARGIQAQGRRDPVQQERGLRRAEQIGRASCRERVCQYV